VVILEGREWCVIFTIVNNVIHIEFYNKDNFPPGKWHSEPDLCYWEREFPCLAIRDMKLGIWKGFVSVDESHPFYGKSIEELFKLPGILEVFGAVHGGLCGVGRLVLPKYKMFASDHWWLGIETSHGEDLFPLVKLDTNDPNMAKMTSNQTYKDFRFIRRETNKLSKVVSKFKCQ
jgi:hypothetical protein